MAGKYNDSAHYYESEIIKIEKIILGIMEKNDLKWYLSDIDARTIDNEDDNKINMKISEFEKKIIQDEVLELNNEDMLLFLESIYDFEFGIIICYESRELLNDIEIYHPRVGECNKKLPLMKKSLLEIRIFEGYIDEVYINDKLKK